MSALKIPERILTEDILKYIYKREINGRPPTVQSIAGAVEIKLDEATHLLSKMAAGHLVVMDDGEFRLTPTGQEYALQIIRAHRLWECYLADETGFDETEWHNQADRQEHTLTPAETEALSARLGHPTHDPHGDPIPTARGELVPHGGQPLNTLAVGQSARIVHVEDEPVVVYAQLVAEGLHPGMDLRLTEISPQRIRFLAQGSEHTLAPVFAANISVVVLPEDHIIETRPPEYLSNLQPGEKGKVIHISPACRGPERRRFMDLGILPGTIITAEMRSPSGDPTAYNIREALIALRQEQAKLIHITRLKEENNHE